MSSQSLIIASLLVRAAWIAETARQRRIGASLRRAARDLTRTAPAPKRAAEAFAGSLVGAVAALALALGLDAAR